MQSLYALEARESLGVPPLELKGIKRGSENPKCISRCLVIATTDNRYGVKVIIITSWAGTSAPSGALVVPLSR